jgi:polar amino acid transport system permease protein
MPDLGVSVLLDGRNIGRILGGLLVTARIALVSGALSMILGMFFGVIMTRRIAAVKFLSYLYLEAMRIVPVLVWLFIFYFGLARNFGISLGGETVCVIVFTLWGTAEMGDLVRGAVTSIPRHQYESAYALGLTERQLYGYVLIPQAVRRLVPSAINLFTRMIKTTSLAVLIGVIEVIKVGQQIIESNFLVNRVAGSAQGNRAASFWVYGLIFFLYFILCMPISYLAKRLEKKWQ